MSLFTQRSFDGLELLSCRPFEERGVPHGFTLRTGGFGARVNGSSDRGRLSGALGIGELTYMQQVHGRAVKVVDERDATPARCDGIVTTRAGLGLVVHTADCVPVLFWASRRRAVAAVHAGWRGTLAGVASEAVTRLEESFGCEPEELHVALGPAIRSCCFEVGDEVVDAFADSGRDMKRIARPGPRGRQHIDLIEDNRRQLVECGVTPSQIYDSERCTACENERFYSYRKEGQGVGRLMGVIAVR